MGTNSRRSCTSSSPESSADGGGYDKIWRAIPSIWGDLSRGEIEGRGRGSGALIASGLDGN
jgi:hypothetical protein